MGFRRGRMGAAVWGGLLVAGAGAAGGCADILGITILPVEDVDTGDAAGGGGGASQGSSGSTGMGPSTSSGGPGGTGGGGGSSSSAGGGSGGAGGAPNCFDCVEPLWTQSLNGLNDQFVNGVASDGQDNTVFVGSFDANADFNGACPAVVGPCPLLNNGNRDVYIVKLNADGMPVWTKTGGDPDIQEANVVAIDGSDNIVVGGRFIGTLNLGGNALTSMGGASYDIFLAKFDPNGTHIWSKSFGDNTAQAIGGVAVDVSGNVVLAGYFQGSIDFGGGALASAGGYDVFVAKLGSDGSHIWSKRFGDSSTQLGTGVTVEAGGAVTITGYCSGMINLGGSGLNCGTETDAFVAKLDSAGAHIWSKIFGNETTGSEGKAVATDGSGNVLVTGSYSSPIDFITGDTHLLQASGLNDTFVSKLAGLTGDAIWSRKFGAAGDQVPTAMVVDGNESVFVTGRMVGSVSFGGKTLTSGGLTDVFVIGYSAAGAALCGVNYGDSMVQEGSSLAVSSSGELLLGANIEGAIDLMCSKSASSMEKKDALVAKLKP